MRLKNKLENKYIGIIEKHEKPSIEHPESIKPILERLNALLERSEGNKKFSFDVVSNEEFKSPSEVLQKENKKKFEKIIQEWMMLCEKFEDIKNNSLHNL